MNVLAGSISRGTRPPVVIHNPFDLSGYEKNHRVSPAPDGVPAEKTIVYTGAVYEAHYSAFRNLIAAIDTAGIPGLKLHIYTSQSETRLAMNGIKGPVVIHRNLPNDRMPDIQRRADLLFLPLAFASEYPDIIRTSATGKNRRISGFRDSGPRSRTPGILCIMVFFPVPVRPCRE